MSLSALLVSSQEEFETFRLAVKNAALPIQDLDPDRQRLYSYFENGALIGTGGLEVVNRVALLRSVSVNAHARGKKLGKTITADLIKKAKDSQLESVYLLTETAKGFFEKEGFQEIKRDEVAPEIKTTTEFSSVCPVSAACMMIKLNSHKNQ